ncbi:transmembrane amino acid transporter protein [Ancylostoma ceylanicum]|uniref:Transmembrane amino acid transporter protein n=1 Tax=Ancylostoma ceylanicum TaxID=53326 RepID=A0A0D6M5C1_9BILA|nr:transmembrane amino acid transporter protein [Ancylostoma ceylanicum]
MDSDRMIVSPVDTLPGQSLDYGDMAAEVCRHSYKWIRPYDRHARWIVNGCLIAFQLGVLSVCFVFVADHILEVIEYITGSRSILSKAQIMLIYFFPQLFLNFIKNIRIITFLSLCGNFIIFIAVGLVSKELIFHDRYMHSSLPAVTDFEGVTMAAGGLIYAFEGQAMVLALENRLKHPADMVGLNGVLCTSMNLVMLLYAFLGFYGYLTFGPAVADSLTLNLPNSSLTIVVKILLVVKLFLGSALQLYVIIAILEPTLSILVGICVPDLYDIIPLVGITAGMMLSLILPALLHTLMFLPVQIKQKAREPPSAVVMSALFRMSSTNSYLLPAVVVAMFACVEMMNIGWPGWAQGFRDGKK